MCKMHEKLKCCTLENEFIRVSAFSCALCSKFRKWTHIEVVMSVCQSMYCNVEFMESVLNTFGVGGLEQRFRV